VFKLVVATPLSSVVDVAGETLPASVVKVTGTPGTPAPEAFSTRAEMADVPPVGLRVCGVALTST
jgi:hypothetical protein